MITLRDGPCKGTLMCRRAPYFLRAVRSRFHPYPIDALDQLDDTPKASEAVHVYRRVSGSPTPVHVNMGRRKGTGFYAMAEYEYLPGVDGEALRDTAAWHAWTSEQKRRITDGE